VRIGLPLMRLNGPRGESATATPMAVKSLSELFSNKPFPSVGFTPV